MVSYIAGLLVNLVRSDTSGVFACPALRFGTRPGQGTRPANQGTRAPLYCPLTPCGLTRTLTNMEVDFGDSELFEQFEADAPVATHIRFTEEDDEEDGAADLHERLEEREDAVRRLKAENEELKRKLNFLSRPKGINVVNSKLDGPLCQILFGNNNISKQCRQEIEDHILSLIQHHQQNNVQDASALHPQPQNSSFVMEETQETNAAPTEKHVRDAFCVVGSVLYFTTFCLDKLGQPLLNENPQLTDGWDVPKYQQVFAQIMALEGQEVQIKEKRPKPCCFNCDADDHQLRDCPKPKDMGRINAKRKEFAQVNQGNILSNQRYHVEEVEERFSKYKPGIVSKDLQDALGIVANTLPPFIYRMRELGYPPGWLKEAEMENSGLTLYDASGEEDSNGPNQTVCYDVSKLVDFPGFNVSAPSGVRDDYRSFGSIPMQPQHWKATFAAQLSDMYPAQPESMSMKRCHDSQMTPQQTKKRRTNSDACGSSDMDTDSDLDTPVRDRFDDFQFQPPLPPDSPRISTPPPLPLGTPPVTPTPPPLPKGTPPPTPPTHPGSPVLPGRGGAGGEESEDGLTLEELEEQQRLLWAELESADNGNSDSTSTPGVASPPSSPLPEGDQGVQESESKAEEPSEPDQELSSTPASLVEVPVSGADEDKSNNGHVSDSLNEDTGGQSLDELIVLDEVTQGSDSDLEQSRVNETPEEKSEPVSDAQVDENDEESAVKKITGVPHRSKFAEGIIPFEDTPEFTEVAEATGVYLRIRGLLKESPRNQAKNKKLTS
ncbi:zinc finger CCHC domain-containing protein 8 isoform 3-T3 [Clarias gariepinus]|uniref:zinc finger CCHC domain-containing protein 8 isoform X3 n=1 Tax=Clarias gariepinus TaxID=13013 RepID=UPI00234CAE7C|nr:zinc finger CCHC domain-containing protein 8 isoform X3 [Clarias gariepinus]